MIATRSFRMGFTRWPGPSSYRHLPRYSDVILHHLDSGVPWEPMATGQPLPALVRDDLTQAMAALPGMQHVVAITPLDQGRTGLAPSRVTADNEPRTGTWATATLAEQRVRDAFARYAEEVATLVRPRWLIVGIEANLLAARGGDWAAFVELVRVTSARLLRTHPGLRVGVSIALPTLDGRDGASVASQVAAIQQLVPHVNFLAASAYPYGWAYLDTGGLLRPLPSTYLDRLASFSKPIAIAESGYPSRAFTAFGTTYAGTEADQQDYTRRLLQAAQAKRAEFVVGWTVADYGPLAESFPEPLRDFARFFAWDGLVRDDDTEKPAGVTWRQWKARPVRGSDLVARA